MMSARDWVDMDEPGRAELIHADGESDSMVRRLWLVAAIDEIVRRPVFLVGGAAVDLHTGSYRPTDIDIVGVVSAADRAALVEAGFTESGGRHLRWDYTGGDFDLVEFPESTLDGTFERIALSDTVAVSVIAAESLVIDRINQATDGSQVTFEDAQRLIVAVADRVDWAVIEHDLRARPDAPYLGSVAMAHALLVASGMLEMAEARFS
jgi:hypothetical protein